MPKKPASSPTAFDQAKAVLMNPAYRHEPTSRTVGYEQPLADGNKALFSITGKYIGIEAGSDTVTEPPCTA
jgi:hypothetical protein